MQAVKMFAVVTFAGLLLSACQTTPVDNSNSQPTAQTNDTPPAAAANTVGNQSTDTNALAKNASDANAVPGQRSVYFDYDSYLLKDEAKPVTEAHAKHLSSNKGRKIVIQGHTDERGGSEYNLALGQKRADAVRKALTLQGVSDSQVEAISFGKEKPKAAGHDEASWAENRRADIVYQ